MWNFEIYHGKHISMEKSKPGKNLKLNQFIIKHFLRFLVIRLSLFSEWKYCNIAKQERIDHITGTRKVDTPQPNRECFIFQGEFSSSSAEYILFTHPGVKVAWQNFHIVAWELSWVRSIRKFALLYLAVILNVLRIYSARDWKLLVRCFAFHWSLNFLRTIICI